MLSCPNARDRKLGRSDPTSHKRYHQDREQRERLKIANARGDSQKRVSREKNAAMEEKQENRLRGRKEKERHAKKWSEERDIIVRLCCDKVSLQKRARFGAIDM